MVVCAVRMHCEQEKQTTLTEEASASVCVKFAGGQKNVGVCVSVCFRELACLKQKLTDSLFEACY